MIMTDYRSQVHVPYQRRLVLHKRGLCVELVKVPEVHDCGSALHRHFWRYSALVSSRHHKELYQPTILTLSSISHSAKLTTSLVTHPTPLLESTV